MKDIAWFMIALVIAMAVGVWVVWAVLFFFNVFGDALASWVVGGS